jgi:hypothetical protein
MLALVPGDTVEIEDDLSAVGEARTLIATVAEVQMLPGEGEQLGELVAHLQLRADPDQARELVGRAVGQTGAHLRDALHPLLRRWDRSDDSRGPNPDAGLSLIPIEADTWHELENGLEVAFVRTTGLRNGDYWLFTTRVEDGETEWLPRPPDGVLHRHAPLALLAHDVAGWRVLEDLRPIFHTAPALSAAQAHERRRLDEANETIEQFRAQIEAMSADVARLRQRVDEVRGQIEQDCVADGEIAQWSVVSADPARAEHIALATDDNAALVVGVVAEVRTSAGESRPIYRVVSYGRVRCRVKGPVLPGDVLVVSDRPGYACRAGIYVQPGTLLGKVLAAPTPDGDDGGLTDVMVMLG